MPSTKQPTPEQIYRCVHETAAAFGQPPARTARQLATAPQTAPYSAQIDFPGIAGPSPAQLRLCAMNATYRKEVSYNGFAIDVLKSALQKYVRRGLVDKALWSMAELDLFYLLPGGAGERIRSNLFSRLRVMYLEEISLSNVRLLGVLDRLFDELGAARKARRSSEGVSERRERELLVEIVLLLAQSPHVRILSHWRAVFTYRARFEALRLPQLAAAAVYDAPEAKLAPTVPFPLSAPEQTLRRAVDNLTYDIEHKRDAAVQWALELLAAQKLPVRRRRSTKPAFLIFDVVRHAVRGTRHEAELADYVALLAKWFRQMTVAEARLCPLAAVVGAVKRDLVAWDKPVPVVDVAAGVAVAAQNRAGKRIDLDAYVFDVHTKCGRQRGMTAVQFATEGALVANLDEQLYNPLYGELYRLSKSFPKAAQKRRQAPAPPLPSAVPPAPASPPAPEPTLLAGETRESEMFEFLVRAQLVTRATGNDTYFAVLRATGEPVVVKGPFLSAAPLEAVLALDRFKWFFAGVYPVRMQRLDLVPDIFGPGEHALGARNAIEPGVAYPFLAAENLCPGPIPSTYRQSKVWPETAVADFARMAGCGHPEDLARMPPAALQSYILAQAFRYVFEIGDPARRNFVYVASAGKVYSIDEEACMRAGADEKKRFLFYRTRRADRVAVLRYVREGFPALRATFEEWLRSVAEQAHKEELLDFLGAEGYVRLGANIARLTNKEFVLRKIQAGR